MSDRAEMEREFNRWQDEREGVRRKNPSSYKTKTAFVVRIVELRDIVRVSTHLFKLDELGEIIVKEGLEHNHRVYPDLCQGCEEIDHDIQYIQKPDYVFVDRVSLDMYSLQGRLSDSSGQTRTEEK